MKETDPLLPETQNLEEGNTNSKWNNLLFLSLGLGPSWGLMNALYLELPLFEKTQPEGVNLAAWMGIAGTAASAVSLLITYHGVLNRVAGEKVALVLVILNILLLVLLAFLWQKTIGGFSLFLFLGTFGGAMVGNLQFMTLIPWVASNFPPTFTNAFMSGSSFMSFVCVVLQLIQSPGNAQRFSPGVFFLVLALPSFLSLCSVFSVQKLVRAKKSAARSISPEHKRSSLCPRWFVGSVLKYTFLNVWSAMMTWWILLIVLPFATANTDAEEHIGPVVLQWATALGIFGLFTGNFLSGFISKDRNFHLLSIVLIMTCLVVFVFLAVFDVPRGGFWRTTSAKVVLVVNVTLIRIGFGFVTPLTFRDIARKLPKNGEEAGRLMAFWTQVFSMFVNVIMFALTTTAVFETKSFAKV